MKLYTHPTPGGISKEGVSSKVNIVTTAHPHQDEDQPCATPYVHRQSSVEEGLKIKTF